MISKKPYLLRANFDWILDSKWTPYLLVNSEYPEVNVPNQYVRDGRIILDISPLACRDLEISQSGVQFSARFSGQLWQIRLPLGSILAIYAKENSQGMTFQPEEEPTESAKAQRTEKPTDIKKPFLKVIHNNDETRS
jgi:stringent starvation protein B